MMLVDTNPMRRMWINQPSTLQPLHDLHGKNVLASEEIRPGTVIIYFLLPGNISEECQTSCLSHGWIEHKVIQ